MKKDEPCQANQIAKKIRRERNLPEGAVVPLLYVCRCPKCSPLIRC